MSGSQNNQSHKTEEEIKKDFDDLVQEVSVSNQLQLEQSGADYTSKTEIIFHISD